ncbi:hypothetical protein TNCV_4796321 [Trichonephila clavipes]|uniref:Uncharacterized protein n=1 Tax=Trichonephila clavipes TaxID=2585209 RepID=A0A8X6VDA6_TRICX|nr:hypothetical protein TNCV_4796321 [Trichonephila clavipes]
MRLLTKVAFLVICIELIHKHPDPQLLDVMTMLVFQYLHLFTVTDSVNKVAKKYARSFKSIIRDKNHERKILKRTTDAAIKLFCKDKFKVELWKETFIAIRKKLETEERIDILQFIKFFFDIVGRIDEGKKVFM